MKKPIFAILIVITLTSMLFLDVTPMENEITYINDRSMIFALPKFDVNIDNVITELSTHSVKAMPLEIIDLDQNYQKVKLSVIEAYYGEINTDEIIVRTQKDLLRVDQEYILFLNQFDSSLYDNSVYTVFSNYVIGIKMNEVGVIQDPINDIRVSPFKNDKYNTLDYIESRLRKVNVNSLQMTKDYKKYVKKFDNEKQLIKASDTILEIEITNIIAVEDTFGNNNIVSVAFELINQYKGEEIENVHRLLLKDEVEIGSKYVVFLSKTYDGGLLPTSKEGSVLDLVNLDIQVQKELEKLR